MTVIVLRVLLVFVLTLRNIFFLPCGEIEVGEDLSLFIGDKKLTIS